MAKRRQKNKQTVSLFPFLSILACVIGTLTLMITGLALGQMDNETFASAVRYQQVKDQIEKSRALIEELKQEIEKTEALADALANARRRVNRLKGEKEQLVKENDKKELPTIEIPAVDTTKQNKRIQELQDELRRQQETKKEFLAELEKRSGPPEEAEVVIQPGGSGIDLDPTFVECTSSGVVIYEGKKPQRVRRGDLATDKAFTGLLDRIAEQPKATVIFLLRDDGLATYNAARGIAISRSARNGKLPIIGHGRIDLSVFKK